MKSGMRQESMGTGGFGIDNVQLSSFSLLGFTNPKLRDQSIIGTSESFSLAHNHA